MSSVKAIKRELNDFLLVDDKGRQKRIQIAELKKQMRNNIIQVENLILTKDNRLVFKKEDKVICTKTISFKSNTIQIIEKTKTVVINGISIPKDKGVRKVLSIKTVCGHICYVLVDTLDTERYSVLLYIPDDVTDISGIAAFDNSLSQYADYSVLNVLNKNRSIFNLYLQVVGGRNVIKANEAFSGFDGKYLSIDALYTPNLQEANKMFYLVNTDSRVRGFKYFQVQQIRQANAMFGPFMETGQKLTLSNLWFMHLNGAGMFVLGNGCNMYFDLKQFKMLDYINIFVLDKDFKHGEVRVVTLVADLKTELLRFGFRQISNTEFVFKR